MSINKAVLFSNEGLTLRRSNPDGTPATPSRILGFSGTVDLSGFGTDAELTIKINSGAEETNTIDWTTAVDPTAVTVTEMVGFINTAAFTDITASQDSVTGRLLIVHDTPASVNFLQVYDGADAGFAAALDFGQGIKYGGEGVKFITAFANTISIGLPKNIKDVEEIETESGDGTLTSIIIAAITKGLNPVLTFNDEDFKMKQLVMGGIYDEAEAAGSYTPPTTAQTDKPIFTVEVFIELYPKGSNKRGDNQGFKRLILWSCTGNEADMAYETKTIPNLAFNLSCTEYDDENGTKIAFQKEINLSTEDWLALDVENL